MSLEPRAARKRYALLTIALVGGMLACGVGLGLSPRARLWVENHLPVGPLYAAFNRARPRLNTANGPDCLDRLEVLGVPARKMSDRLLARENGREPDCPLVNGVDLRWPLAEKRYMTCALAEALFRYYTEVLEPAGVRFYGQPVVRIEDAGVRSCKNMAAHRHLRSEHAYANAIDMRAFVLRDGRTIDIESHWNDPEHAGFLREIADGACRIFHVVLTPGSDELHDDHFHADVGVWRRCE